MENQTPRIAVAIRYKKAFREWLKSLPWVNNIPAHMLISSGRVIIVDLPVDMVGDEDWFEQFIQDNYILFFQMELEIFIPEDASEEELDRYEPKNIGYKEYLKWFDFEDRYPREVRSRLAWSMLPQFVHLITMVTNLSKYMNCGELASRRAALESKTATQPK